MIGCVAGRCVLSGRSSTESGGYHGEHHHFFGRIWNKGYHGSMGASRWFCKFYCDKAVIVGLISYDIASQAGNSLVSITKYKQQIC